MAITPFQSPQTTVYQLFIRGGVFDNTKAALREIADQAGFAYEKAWTTQQFGSKLVDFLNANSAQTPASKSEPNKSQKQHVRVEVEITEHDYVAFDSDEEMTDSFAFHGVDQIRIYVDGEDTGFDDYGLDGDTHTDYEPFDLEEKWDNEDIVKFGYYENRVETIWEFDVEKFDINKLSFHHQCFDVIFGPADYNCEEDWLTLRYDGQSLEDNIVASNTSDGDFQQEWYMYDDEDDCDSDFAEDEEEFEIDTQGNRIEGEETEEDVTGLLSKVFGTLAWVMADMDDEVTDEEIQAILGIANGFEIFDLDEVRQRLMFEKMGIRDYNSHTALAESVPAKYRTKMFQALTVVAASDFKIKQSEVALLGGLSEIWELDWDTTANDIINSVMEHFSASHPDREVEIE